MSEMGPSPSMKLDQASIDDAYKAIRVLDHFMRVVMEQDPDSLASTFANFDPTVNKSSLSIGALFSNKFQDKEVPNLLINIIKWITYGVDRLTRRLDKATTPPGHEISNKEQNWATSGFGNFNVPNATNSPFEKLRLLTGLASCLGDDLAAMSQNLELAKMKEEVANKKIAALEKKLDDAVSREAAALGEQNAQLLTVIEELTDRNSELTSQNARQREEHLREKNELTSEVAVLTSQNAKQREEMDTRREKRSELLKKLEEKREIIRKMKELLDGHVKKKAPVVEQKSQENHAEEPQGEKEEQMAAEEQWTLAANLPEKQREDLVAQARVKLGIDVKPVEEAPKLTEEQLEARLELFKKAQFVMRGGKMKNYVPQQPRPTSQ